MTVCLCAMAYSQTDTIRYVKPNGAYSNDGRSWATAKNRVQDAINDLHDYLVQNNLTSGSVYIAAGTYIPTESTESSGGSMLNTAFKIYAGIHVYGGFNPRDPEEKPGDRIMANGKKVSENWSDPSGIGTTSGTEISSQWDLQHKTILTGNHSSSVVSFVFDPIRGRYNTAFPANSYHVVWFATNGKYDTDGTADELKDHYRPLDKPASLDGCVISSGNASSRSTTVREHTAYGGGVYMVGNSSLRACIIERCNATMRGGGIYMDGGGSAEFCYVHTCQSVGVGVYQGYGGGVCIDYEGSIGHSHIQNCAARCGGGLCINHVPEEYPVTGVTEIDNTSNYSPFATACVISNNTSNAEGGGIYLAEGGTVNHCTVCANNCMGPDVTYYGRRHGRTGGIYVRNCGMIFNSVFWGNRCDANNDIQFASVRQKTGIAEYETFTYHTAFMNHDITDWTGVRKEAVYSLDEQNMPAEGSSANHPCFFNPTVDPDNWEHVGVVDADHTLYGAGVITSVARTVDLPGPRVWHLTSYSALDQKGVQYNETMSGVSEWLIHAHTDYGVVSNPYEPASTLGALVRKPDPITYALIAPQGLEGRLGGDPIPTIFIDPNRKGVFVEGVFTPQEHEGNSWDTPIRDLGEGVQYFRQRFVDADLTNRYYHLPKLDSEGNPTGEFEDFHTVQILVKEGTCRTVGPGNYASMNIRSAAIVTYGHMRFYGGYPSSLTGTDTEGRNPRSYRSTIRCRVTGEEGAAGYENNSAHAFALVNADNVVIDGFMLQDANTHAVVGALAANDGGCVVVNNSTIDASRRVNMVNNQLRNCVINNCSSSKGAGIFVNAEWPNAVGDTCYAELKVVNTIIRNCKTADALATLTYNEGGIVTANGRSFIHLDHCNIMNNVGIPLTTDNRRTDNTTMGYHGYIRMDNSMVYCNTTKVYDLYTDIDANTTQSVNEAGDEFIYGSYNMFDADLYVPTGHSEANHPKGFFKSDYTVPELIDGFVPAGVTSTLSDDVGKQPSRTNKKNLTRVSTDSNYPSFVNPSRLIGSSVTGDKALYGGTVSYTPMTTNPCVNAAGNTYAPIENFDRSDYIVRNCGGEPDIGAIENTDLPAAGAVIYVTPNGAGKRDGSSWSNAIAGNTIYALNGAGAAGTDQLDEANGTTRIINTDPTIGNVEAANGVPTTDDRYCGGFARTWITSSKLKETTTTVTDTWTTEVNVYVGGERDGEHEIEKDKEWSESEETVPDGEGADEPGFVPGWDSDARYPYGELSGASRSFWRANPYHSGTDWNNAADYSLGNFEKACDANGWINNTRRENYVSGLQYAVEEAARRNHVATRREGEVIDTLVQVWVGAGHYTDYKGYVMRDSVTVYGGFPASRFAAPGMAERQALMSDVVSIPKSLPAQDLDAGDYETILQISDVKPSKTDKTLNLDAVKFQDNDLSRTQTTNTRSYEYKTKHITNTYTFVHKVDNTSRYINYPAFEEGSTMHPYEGAAIPDTTEYIYGNQATAAAAGKDVWHVRYPNTKQYYVVNFDLRTSEGLTVYDYDNPNSNTPLQTYAKPFRKYHIGNGSLTGLRMYQTMKNVEAGTHRFTLDFMGGYRAGSPFDKTTPSNIWLYIQDAEGNNINLLDANGVDIVDSVLFKCRGSAAKDSANTNVRARAFRKTLKFTTTTAQDITILVKVFDGTKNTKSANATNGTDDGRDPDYIPWNYAYDEWSEDNLNEKKKWGTNNPNRREFFITNLKLETIKDSYEFTDTDEAINDTVVENPKASEEHTDVTYKIETTRTPLRKRVLTMPDVCVPTYGGGGVGDPSAINNRGKYGDDLSHTDRVWGPTKAKRTSSPDKFKKREDPHYVEYNEVNWDGFTIRHGFLYAEGMGHGGGAGVNMYEGAHLRNCIVVDNMSYCPRVKGGGIFCDGATSTIEGCFALNNMSVGTSTHATDQKQVFAGGMFLYEGTCFNSLFANNYSWGSAGGVGFCVGQFFNNTIAYNTCSLVEAGHINGGGISLATESKPNLFVANTIVYGNSGMAIRERTESQYQGAGLINPFLHCYIQTKVPFSQDTYLTNIVNHSDDGSSAGIGNILLNGEDPSAANTPFEMDLDNEGNYTGNSSTTNNFRLLSTSGSVNKGTEAFETLFKTALQYKGKTDSEIEAMPIYNSVKATVIPSNDVAFAKRVQDCQIDMGAYEFNAAYNILPDTVTHPGQAIFYVTFVAPGGDASANSPDNAACKQKLQLVLDAAGRYKYNLMNLSQYSSVAETPVSREPDKSWTVEVWLEGDNRESTTSDEYQEYYTPTRSTKHNVPGYHDNTLDYSFIVPHGVQVKGGYKDNFYHYENAAGEPVSANAEGAHIVDDRDPLTYRTVLSGNIVSSTGAEGQTFHVVTFTEDLFDPDEHYYTEDKGGGVKEAVRNQLATLTDEKHRAVLDGLFIMDGYANSSDPEDQIGAGAVVTSYAHVRNCVVQYNTALSNGGGLYLKPLALVSGTIIKKNSANIGGGIYIEAPVTFDTDSLARIFTSTICENSASTSAGGMWFDNTYARVNSTALWHNAANDNANVSGSFARSDMNTDYPFNFCAVESRRLEGQGNIELSPRETEGVRWDRQDPFDAILYYPIEMSSTLSRAGMTYTEWNKAMTVYTTLESFDIAGVHRARWKSDGSERGFAWTTDTLVTKNNDFIEIGARAINKNFAINVNTSYVMNRLYVMHTDLINSKAARDLQDNTNTDDVSNMYRQMGSCILNPFHRLGDAFDYIIAARKSNPVLYRNRVFEVFIEQGTYYPYHNAYGEQDEVRNNTFLVPEGIYVIGGVDSRPEDHHYGQEGYYDQFTGAAYGTKADVMVNVTLPSGETPSYLINSAPLDTIRLRDDRHRPMRDNNLNSVIEPWELERQTILSGNAVSGEDFTHVYHVITMHADSNYVGPQPLKYRQLNPDRASNPSAPLLIDPIPMNRPDLFSDEIELSILGRTTEFDGIQINGGYANHLDAKDTVTHHYVTKTYFRGGGIFVDGNWTKSFDEEDAAIPNVTDPALYNIPIVVENCIFTNNMAGNGGGLYSNGGIYMFACHFTQNYSQGPMTKLDQKYIPWTAGGCIATNAFCGVSNTLFDNNEARRGLYPLMVKNPKEVIPNADARQGFGGVLSVATDSRMRVVNCHFMKNKAVAYSAIYNFTPNNEYTDPDKKQFAFNTIFWGNEVFEVESLDELEKGKDWDADDNAKFAESCATFNNRYKSSRTGVFHYDGTEWQKYEKLFHEYDSTYHYWAAKNDTFNINVTSKLQQLREQGDKMEGLFFCSYRKTYGPSGMKPSSDGYLLKEAEQRAFVDPRKMPVRVDPEKMIEKYDDLFSHVHGNNNTLVNRINNATDGPNFRQPTFVAGIDGYMQNADWVLARMNLTTDQGWGYLTQTVTRGVAYYITKYTGADHFDTAEEALAAAELVNPSATEKDVYPVSGLPVATFDASQPSPGAMYNFLSARYGAYMSSVNAPLPLKDQYYMAYTRSTSDDEQTGNMERISRHPRMKETDVYIDVGIYEYQYVQLDIKGRDIDTMWVATKAKDPIKHDGLTWETPTTDLQTAIDMLMASHNNHDKYICFMGDAEGTFSPSNVVDNRRSFTITSSTLEPLLPDSAEADYDYGVNSLTFLGGYSYDVKDAPRDPLANPVVIEMPHIGTESQLNQLFVIEDMTRQMVQLNWAGEVTTRDSVVIPIVFDGITFVNPYSVKEPSESAYSSLGGSMSKKGGAAIYYRWQRRYEDDGTSNGTPNFNLALHPDSALIDGRKVTLPKLTLSNCIFMDNGARDGVAPNERSAAVRIDHGGGSSLIVNSLFHSNAGAPIYAKTFDVLQEENDLATVPNDVFIINCTSALNDGHIRLEGDNSEVHNSLIWLDDLGNDTTVQLQMGASYQWDKETNSTREGIENRVTNNAIWGCFMQPGEDPYGNDSLVTENSDIYGGPGFVLPYVTASTSTQRRERSFRLNPSLMTQNMADTTVYRNKVFFHMYPDTCAETHGHYWRRSNGFKSVYIVSLVDDSDLAAKPRLSGDGMERGAYECIATLQRVLYVQPTLSAFAAGDGSSWEHPFGQGQLQNAIDAAAVYTYLRQNDPTREDRKAYVFVKGSYESHDHTEIHARDGVFVYGSLPSNFNDTAVIDPDTKQFTNAECQRYVNYVRALSTGVASPNATPTRINLVHMEGDDFDTGFLLDGFVITNPGATLYESPVILDNELSALRNCLITDNKVKDLPVVDVTRGLLYNNLIYSDSGSVMVKVGANGLALNNTIVSDEADVEPMDVTAAPDVAVVNNIALNTTSATVKPFAPYLTDQTPYSLPFYLTENKPLAYQLHEHSALINADAGTDDSALPAIFGRYVADSTIAFRYDRDVLGNPRKISTRVDMGALETWYVEKDSAQEITARTNKVGSDNPLDAHKFYAFLEHYGGNSYPHVGSVVYLMDSAVMTMQYEDLLPDFVDLKTGNDTIALRPGFLLLKPGASFYGNGHKVQIGYIAAEKRFQAQRYTMTAMPFKYSADNITVTAYDADKDSLGHILSPFAFNTYQYDGAARSAKDYVFQTDNSTLWQKIDTLNRTATDGYLMDFGGSFPDTVLRFNAFAANSGEYIYTEDGSDKTVLLTQYDHRNAGTGENLNFTRHEDMGWNMKGLPWLVTNYRTDTILEEGNYQRQMFIPHVFYQMGGDGNYITEGDKIYSSRSWDKGSVMSMGNAFFTQTATQEKTETVVFSLPYYGFNEKVSRPILRVASRRPYTGKSSGDQSLISSDILSLIPDPMAAKTVEYSYGRDGLKWVSNSNSVLAYLLDSKRMSRISLLGAAPTEVDIPLGIYVPDSLCSFTFSLPEPEAFEDYKYVWLIDNSLNRYINLLFEDYETSVEPGENNRRFAIRIGGFPKTDQNGNRQYVVYSYDGTLFVRGLIAGDIIRIYSAGGQLILNTVATAEEFTTTLPQTGGIYAVQVNDFSKKVRNL
ncbi:MAG: hypothetical protein IKN59_03680 [Paludibacteraceae bacterium]|nr:hypothetical protein [Paludibacteraceae bacterium]